MSPSPATATATAAAPAPPPIPANADHHSRVPDVLATQITLMSLGTLAVLVRMGTRIFIMRTRPTTSDWLIVASLMLALVEGIDICTQTMYGLGHHWWDLSPDTDASKAMLLFFIGEANYFVAVALIKLSILFIYLRLSSNNFFRVFIYIMMGVIVSTGIAFFVACLLQCTPMNKVWQPMVEGYCYNPTHLFFANAGIDLVQDLIIYLMPVHMLWKLKLPTKQRLGLIFIFIVGGFVVITGAIRIKSLTFATVSADPTYDNVDAANWSSIHLNVGIACACLAHLKPLIARFAPGILGMTRVGTGSNMQLKNVSYGPRSGRSHNSKNIAVITDFKVEDNQSQTNILTPDDHSGPRTHIQSGHGDHGHGHVEGGADGGEYGHQHRHTNSSNNLAHHQHPLQAHGHHYQQDSESQVHAISSDHDNRI